MKKVSSASCVRDQVAVGMTRRATYGDNETAPVGGLPFAVRCPAGQRVTGITADTSTHPNRLQLQVRSGGRLDAVGAICANRRFGPPGAAGNTMGLHYTTMAGGTGGFASELRCPNRSFVTGLRSWAQATPELGGITSIHGIEPYCRQLEP